jgi:hypothetical protein
MSTPFICANPANFPPFDLVLDGSDVPYLALEKLAAAKSANEAARVALVELERALTK